MYRDPMNKREWQETVDAAAALMESEAARRYGMVDVERCEEPLEQAAERADGSRG